MSNTRKATKPSAAILDEYTIEFEGETYTITREDMDDLDLMLMFANGNVMGAVMQLVGAEDWKRFEDSVRTDKGKIPMTKAKQFVDMIADGPLGNFASSLGS